MKKQIITGAICGGIGLLFGYKLTINKLTKLLNSDELKQQLTKDLEDRMSEYRGSKTIYKDIVFETRTDAMKVIEDLQDIIDNYKVASVADLYDIVELPSNFTDNKYGWTDISTVEVCRNENGYSLKMPKVTKIN